MTTMKGLSNGIGWGCIGGILANAAFAVMIATITLPTEGFEDAFGFAAMVLIFGSIVAGILGSIVGGIAGAILGATKTVAAAPGVTAVITAVSLGWVSTILGTTYGAMPLIVLIGAIAGAGVGHFTGGQFVKGMAPPKDRRPHPANLEPSWTSPPRART